MNTLKHQMEDGRIETRATKASYTCVVVGFGKPWNATIAADYVLQWSAAPASAYRSKAKWERSGYNNIRVEFINGGVRRTHANADTGRIGQRPAPQLSEQST